MITCFNLRLIALKIIILAGGIFFSGSLRAQNADSVFISRVAHEILNSGVGYEHLRHLTKKIGARLSGSAAITKAEDWGYEVLKQSGADNVFRQEVLTPNWKRGGKDEVLLLQNGKVLKSLSCLALGNSVGSGKNGIKAPVIEVSSFDELEARKDEIKGRIVFYNYPFKNELVRTFEAYSDAAKYRSTGPSRAARYGAVGVVIRSMSHGANNFAHTGGTRYDTAYPKISALALGLEDADWLSRQLQSDKNFQLLLRSYGSFLPDALNYNIIGELKGTVNSDTYITIGGHLDSWDVGEGAHDDGAGIVQTIEVLNVLKKLNYKPRHTLRFVFFANEENGVRGGDKYAELAKKNNEKHLVAIESDAGGFTPRGFSTTGNAIQISKMQQWLPLLFPYGITEIKAGGSGVDIGPLKTVLGTPGIGYIPDSQRYFDLHHAHNDVFEAVNRRELELGAVCMAALIYLLDKYGL